ncbi:MAG: HEAT repeat domain-containing protein, partial [Deltaproteobacteria bacterium]|nr:HEAT repeat domain-containing protein [Deltaproteobacteria bacterium]
STAVLIAALEEEEESLVSQAVISLGMLKDTQAIDLLGKIALKRDPFSEPKDVVKEAIKALGNIGDERCVPYLANILSRKVWLGKKANEEARVLAAAALGMTGTPAAYTAIEKVRDDSSGDLFNACKRILDGRTRR